MSLDELHDMEELDLLAEELAEAGRSARLATAVLEAPDREFAARLRARLVGQLPQSPLLATPVPPTRPWQSLEPSIDRRAADRPFFGLDRRTAAPGNGYTAIPGDELSLQGGKRWHAEAAAVHPSPADGLPDDGEAAHVAVLRPKVQWRVPTKLMPARWVAIGLAACFVAASFMWGSTLFFPDHPSYATVQVAEGATLVRGGVSSPLDQGVELRAGDEIRVGTGGAATLAMGESFVRMAAGADVRLDGLAPDRIVISQLAGRAYHRVGMASGGTYQVVTASASWTATGTAFDIDRQGTSTGEEVRGLALLDGLEISAPSLHTVLAQGQSAVIELSGSGSVAGAAAVSAIDAQTLADPWLIGNARLDALAGLPLGVLAGLVETPSLPASPTPTWTPAFVPTVEPTAAPTPTPSPTPAPTARPTPTRKPTPKPTPAGPPYLGKLTIVKNGDGTYAFSWPQYTGSGFQYYKLVYGPAGTQPSYNGSNYWAANDTVDNTSWTGSIDPGNYAVRLQVVDLSNGIVIRAQTNVVTLKVAPPATPQPTLPPVQSLGALNVSDDGSGCYTFSWAPYTGGWGFDAYKLVYVAGSGNPSYLSGADYWAALSPGATTTDPIALPSGTWSVRVQAIGWPFGGSAYAFAQTTVLHLTVP
jgi:hypothetical protein